MTVYVDVGEENTNVLNSKLKNASTNVWETAVAGTEYFSPDQHGGYFGTVYRQYFGAKSNGNTITATGISKLLDFVMQVDSVTVAAGHTHDGAEYTYLSKGTNLVNVVTVGNTIESGWLDYVK